MMQFDPYDFKGMSREEVRSKLASMFQFAGLDDQVDDYLVDLVYDGTSTQANKKSLVQKDAPDDCGTGAGGFKEGNTCATGESAGEAPGSDPVKQKEQQQTAAFKQFFGQSQAVDHKGDPLVVYHGTPATIDENFAFSESKIGSVTDSGFYGRGFYFVGYPQEGMPPARGEAGYYGKNVHGFYLRMENPMRFTADVQSGAPDIEKFMALESELRKAGLLTSEVGESIAAYKSEMPAIEDAIEVFPIQSGSTGESLGFYAKIDREKLPTSSALHGSGEYTVKPSRPAPKGEWFYYDNVGEARRAMKQQAWRAMTDKYDWLKVPTVSDYLRTEFTSSQITDRLKSAGYDGVIYGDEYLVFDADQIKSAEFNDGSFSREDNRVGKSLVQKDAPDDCGTGAGGFKEDNTCATGSEGSGGAKPDGAAEKSRDTVEAPGATVTPMPSDLNHNPQVDTENFKEWFRNGVQHSDGEPVTLFHGTKRGFEEFAGSTRYEGAPYFLTTNPEFAGTWPEGSGGLRNPEADVQASIAKIEQLERDLMAPAYERIKDEIGDWPDAPRDSREFTEYLEKYDEIMGEAREELRQATGFSRAGDAANKMGIRIVPVYAAPQKTFYPPRDHKLIEPVIRQIAERDNRADLLKVIEQGDHKYGNWIVYERPDVMKFLQSEGYDGMWLTESLQPGKRDHTTLAMWNPKLVKSSIGNNGDFDPDNPNMTKSLVTKDAPDDCGTGAGGFKEDNTCATGESAASIDVSSADAVRFGLAAAVAKGEREFAGVPIQFEDSGRPWLHSDEEREAIDRLKYGKDDPLWDQYQSDAANAVRRYTVESATLNAVLREQGEVGANEAILLEDYFDTDEARAYVETMKSLDQSYMELQYAFRDGGDYSDEAFQKAREDWIANNLDKIGEIENFGSDMERLHDDLADAISAANGNTNGTDLPALYELSQEVWNAASELEDAENYADFRRKYDSISSAVRHGAKIMATDIYTTSGVASAGTETVEALDDLTATPIMSSGNSVRVFRGVNLNSVAGMAGGRKWLGSVLSDALDMDNDDHFVTNSFTSTSLDWGTATSFTGSGISVVYDIKAKNGVYAARMSAHPSEQEVILGRNKTFRIIDKRWVVRADGTKGFLYVRAEEVN